MKSNSKTTYTKITGEISYSDPPGWVFLIVGEDYVVNPSEMPKSFRFFWLIGVFVFFLCMVVLFISQDPILKTGMVAIGPFALLIMCLTQYGIHKGYKDDLKKGEILRISPQQIQCVLPRQKLSIPFSQITRWEIILGWKSETGTNFRKEVSGFFLITEGECFHFICGVQGKAGKDFDKLLETAKIIAQVTDAPLIKSKKKQSEFMQP